MDKQQYWENRKAHRRGQGEVPALSKLVVESGVEQRMSRTGLVPFPRRDRRTKLVHRYVKPGDTVGRKFTQTGVVHYERPPHYAVTLPTKDPRQTNHQRHAKLLPNNL
jgi:hypothetical protein